jgi:predicted HicB family RNase H-like nuclease
MPKNRSFFMAPTPQDDERHTTTLRIPMDLYWRVMRVMAQLRRKNLNALVIELLERFVDEHERPDRR